MAPLQVNEMDVSAASHEAVIDVIRNSASEIVLTVSRQGPSGDAVNATSQSPASPVGNGFMGGAAAHGAEREPSMAPGSPEVSVLHDLGKTTVLLTRSASESFGLRLKTEEGEHGCKVRSTSQLSAAKGRQAFAAMTAWVRVWLEHWQVEGVVVGTPAAKTGAFVAGQRLLEVGAGGCTATARPAQRSTWAVILGGCNTCRLMAWTFPMQCTKTLSNCCAASGRSASSCKMWTRSRKSTTPMTACWLQRIPPAR